MPPSSPRLLAALTVGTLALAACGGGESSSSSAGGGSPTTSSAGGAGGSGGAAAGTTTATGTTATSTATATATATSTGSGSSSSSSSSGTGGGAPCAPGDVQACYNGPKGTEDVGACKGGMKTCMPNGAFGPCVGEVTPSPELCSTPIDDDCNGKINEGGLDCACAPNATTACYGGPPGTEDVGICKGGMKTCSADGLAWGPCLAEVLPAFDDCITPEDEDCDSFPTVCTGDQSWAKRAGDAGAQAGNGIALFAGGPVVTGALAGSADFGGGALTSAGGNDVFVARLDYLGQHLWSKRYGDAVAQSGARVATDALGNVLVIGDFAGKIDFGGGALTSAGGTDVFVVKLDPNGAHLWSKRYGDAAAQTAGDIAADAQGNVVFTGTFAGSVNLGGGALASAGGTDVFVGKLDPAGIFVWGKRYGDAMAQAARGIAADAQGDVVITGDLSGGADFGGGVLTSAGGTDVFVAEFDPAGVHVWSKRFGNNANQTATDVDVDAVGNVLITGSAAGKIDFGAGQLTSAGGTDVFVAKFTTAGAHLWSKLFGTAGNQDGRAVALDPGGAVLLAGDFTGSIDFGGGALASAGAADAFVVKLDAFGAHVWSKKAGDAVAQTAQGIAADLSGVFAVGTFAGVINFGGGALTSAGGNDVFVTKLQP